MHDSQPTFSINAVFQSLVNSCFSPRTSWWIALVCVECVLDLSNHHALKGGTVTTYKSDDENFVLDFDLLGGWNDRRYLQPISVECLIRNQGSFFAKEDIRGVDKELAKVFHLADGKHHRQLVELSRQFWSTRLPGVLFGHCTGDDRFQLLGRYQMWRRATLSVSLIKHKNDVAVDFLGWAQPSNTYITADYVVSQVEDIARRKGVRDAGRQCMVECIDQHFPAALVEGQMQALALVCLKEVIQTGGMSGKLLAPSSISTYLGTTFVPWVRALIDSGMESEQETYTKAYTSIISSHPSSRQGQAKALIDILHTRLVLRGAPLLRSLGNRQLQSVPRAQVIWPHEIELALEYVSRAANDQRLADQARLVILLGLAIPLRTSEYFQIRLVDVCPKGIASLVVFPRRKDGTHKSSHNRLHADIGSATLCDELLNYKSKRCAEESLPSEDSSPTLFFFGAPGYPDSAYGESQTIDLVNQAIRWATGDPQASVYSLRHTVISARALACLASEASTDAMAWESMSKQCGHGNPDSTSGYVHQIEDSLRQAIARYVDANVRLCTDQVYEVVDLKNFFNVHQRVCIEQVSVPALKTLKKLTTDQFIDLMNDLATGLEIPVVVAKFKLQEDAIGQLFKLIRERWTSGEIRLLTERDVRVSILSWGPRARHIQQSKYKKIRGFLQNLSVEAPATRALAYALETCCKENDIDLDLGYWSDVLFQCLVEAGYRKGELVVFAIAPDSVPDAFARNGTLRAQSFRRGRAAVRLGLIDSHIFTPDTASGAAYSASGLAWLSKALNLWLAVHGEY